MLAWITRSLLPDREVAPELDLSKLLEDPHMLADTVKDWPTRWLAEGREKGRKEGRKEGRQEGRQKGRVEGLRKALRRMMELKFCARSAAYMDRLEEAGEDTLLLWTERKPRRPQEIGTR